jgi:hypothetical protein
LKHIFSLVSKANIRCIVYEQADIFCILKFLEINTAHCGIVIKITGLSKFSFDTRQESRIGSIKYRHEKIIGSVWFSKAGIKLTTFMSMIRNYFKIASRSLLKNKAFSIINILGPAIGIAFFGTLENFTNSDFLNNYY